MSQQKCNLRSTPANPDYPFVSSLSYFEEGEINLGLNLRRGQQPQLTSGSDMMSVQPQSSKLLPFTEHIIGNNESSTHALRWSRPRGKSANRSTPGSLCPLGLGPLSLPCLFTNASNIMSEQIVQQSGSEYLRHTLSLFFLLLLHLLPPSPPHFSLSAEEHD